MTNRPSRRLAGAATSLALLSVLVGACIGQSAAAPTEPPVTSTPSPSQIQSPAGTQLRVAVATGNGTSVDVVILDESGDMVSAESGKPRDGASVEPYIVEVVNADASTLQLPWVGGPCDHATDVTIDGSGRRVLIVQPECSGDAVAFDRVLRVRFSAPVNAADVLATLQDGIDT